MRDALERLDQALDDPLLERPEAGQRCQLSVVGDATRS
jgi:hypothetical protein